MRDLLDRTPKAALLMLEVVVHELLAAILNVGHAAAGVVKTQHRQYDTNKGRRLTNQETIDKSQ